MEKPVIDPERERERGAAADSMWVVYAGVLPFIFFHLGLDLFSKKGLYSANWVVT